MNDQRTLAKRTSQIMKLTMSWVRPDWEIHPRLSTHQRTLNDAIMVVASRKLDL